MPTRTTLLCLLLTACSPTLGEVKEQNKTLIAQTQKRIELVRRALIGARDDVDPACKPPTPLHPAFDGTHDAEVMSFGALERAGAEHDAYAKGPRCPSTATRPWKRCENRKTGEKTVVRSDSHDNFEEAMSRKRDEFGVKLKAAWGIGLDRK